MNGKRLLASIVAELRTIPAKLSGDDSPLPDPWEEIKYQVQQELSIYWLAYLETVKAVIDSAVTRLAPEEVAILSSELKVPSENRSQISKTLLRRLLLIRLFQQSAIGWG